MVTLYLFVVVMHRLLLMNYYPKLINPFQNLFELTFYGFGDDSSAVR
jgi:hypothetical protein